MGYKAQCIYCPDSDYLALLEEGYVRLICPTCNTNITVQMDEKKEKK